MKSVLVIVTVAGVAMAISQYLLRPTSHFSASVHHRITGMERGTEKYEVFELLGQPWRSDTVCCLPKRKEFHLEFAKAETSEAVEFHCWRNGDKAFYCIGFDDQQRMIVLLQGR